MINMNAQGGHTAKFEDIGDGVEGVVLFADEVPQTDIETGKPVLWDDGKPRMQWVVDVQTANRDDDDDDGIRRVYAKGGKFEAASGTGTSLMVAIRDAVRAAGASALEEGGTLKVRHTGLGKKKTAAYAAPKLYQAKYDPPAKGVAVGQTDW